MSFSSQLDLELRLEEVRGPRILAEASRGLTRPLLKSGGGGLSAGCGTLALTLKCHRDPTFLLISEVWEALLTSSRLRETLSLGPPLCHPGVAPGSQWLLCTRVLTECM